jgi:hypothetical protein
MSFRSTSSDWSSYSSKNYSKICFNLLSVSCPNRINASYESIFSTSVSIWFRDFLFLNNEIFLFLSSSNSFYFWRTRTLSEFSSFVIVSNFPVSSTRFSSKDYSTCFWTKYFSNYVSYFCRLGEITLGLFCFSLLGD